MLHFLKNYLQIHAVAKHYLERSFLMTVLIYDMYILISNIESVVIKPAKQLMVKRAIIVIPDIRIASQVSHLCLSRCSYVCVCTTCMHT